MDLIINELVETVIIEITQEHCKCSSPALVHVPPYFCSGERDRTADLWVMTPTLLPSELPRQFIGF